MMPRDVLTAAAETLLNDGHAHAAEDVTWLRDTHFLEMTQTVALTQYEMTAILQFWSYGATRGNHSNEGSGPPPGPLTPYRDAMAEAARKMHLALAKTPT